MKRFVRSLLGVSLAAGLIVSQLPSKASCQMSLSTGITACAMKCCQKSMPAKCPMMKTETPPDDRIMSIASLPEMKLRFLAIIPSVQNVTVRMPSWRLSATSLIQRWVFLSRPTIGRAPPAEILLLQA